MKKQHTKGIGAAICLLLLLLMQGCAVFANRGPGKSWSQISAEEEQQRELGDSLPGDSGLLP